MEKEHKIQIAIGILGAACTIIAAIIGANYGENKQQEYVQSQIANISGDDNVVNMNNVNDLVDNYNKLLVDNETLKTQNKQYFDDYQVVKEENESLTVQLQGSPSIQLKNLGLCINGEDSNVNQNNSYAIINGAEYFSKEFINCFIDENMSLTMKDDIMYVGKVVADKENLFSLRVVDSNEYEILDNLVDSYGNTHSNAAKLSAYNSYVAYNLNGIYSLLRFKIAIDESSYSEYNRVITIYADGKAIYTSKKLEKVKTKEIVEKDIHINNCTLLEIKCSGDRGVYPIIYDAEVYN